MIKYKVALTKEEHEELMNIVSKGSHTSQQYRIAYILLNCDEGKYGEKNSGIQISRVLKVSARMIDRAEFIKKIADEWYKDAEKIILVMDNLATHKASALYETYPPKEAKRIWDRFNFVYTPKYGNWLNMAEIELLN